jgi:hypothetical protein
VWLLVAFNGIIHRAHVTAARERVFAAILEGFAACPRRQPFAAHFLERVNAAD